MAPPNDKLIATREIDAPADAIFALLADPRRHVELDGSGYMRSDQDASQITGTGEVFTMNMSGDHMGGDYQSENHVTAYEKNKQLAWKTAPAGQKPPGWQWEWDLEPITDGSTKVTLTYDWSEVTDEEILAKLHFPFVPQSGLDESLSKLVSAVS